MHVRPVRATDAPFALGLLLDQRAQLVGSVNSSRQDRLAACSALLGVPGREKAWMVKDQRDVGLIGAVPREYVIGWDLTQLAVRGNVNKLVPVLTDAVTSHVQALGVGRLFARVNGEDHPLTNVGFRPLAREYVMEGAAEPAPEEDPLPAESRYRMPEDAWPLHQLEMEITPTYVSQVEGSTSARWSSRRPKLSQIVVERNGQIVAWIGWRQRRAKSGDLSLLLHPSHMDLASPLLNHVLRQARDPGVKFRTRVRDYQPETLNAMQRAGFSIEQEQIMLVKHGLVDYAKATQGRLKAVKVPSLPVLQGHCSLGSRAN
jgi:hypothetical protein